MDSIKSSLLGGRNKLNKQTMDKFKLPLLKFLSIFLYAFALNSIGGNTLKKEEFN